MPIDRRTAKEVSLFLVKKVAPDESDAVEDGFDSLAENGFRVPKDIPQHAFHVPPEIWTYSQSVAVFVGGVFAGALKDVLKDRLAKLLERWLKSDPPLKTEEQQELIRAVNDEAKALKIPDDHCKRLEEDFKRILGATDHS